MQGIIIQVSRFIIPWEEGNIGSNLPKAHRNNGKWSFGILQITYNVANVNPIGLAPFVNSRAAFFSLAGYSYLVVGD